MDKEQLVSSLESLIHKLDQDVIPQLRNEYSMGVERWDSWVRQANKFFEANLSYYLPNFNSKVDARIGGIFGQYETRDGRFMRRPVEPMKSFLRSLIIDAAQGELVLSSNKDLNEKIVENIMLRKAFIVHGHDESTKLRTARFLEKLGFDAVILHEQASGGRTIIEKLEHFTDVGFGIVLYTPDDVGEVVANQANLRPRARQNVVFEHGLLLGKLGRERVLPLVTDHSVELPGDISGMVYMSDRNWEIDLAKEIKALGYEVDLNVLF